MTYSFPIIIHLDQVRKAILGKPEFIIAEREGYQVVNYMVADKETFPPVTNEDEAILRECRGLIFSESGRVIARRYHKFFNINERDETDLKNIDWSKKFDILDKLDGSMITPIPFYDENFNIKFFRLSTKMGITEIAMQAETFVSTSDIEYDAFCKNILAWNFTPIFEWCSRKNRIVIDHPEDKLVLTAIRHNRTGEYQTHESVKSLVVPYNIPVVGSYSGSWSGIDAFLSEVKDLEGSEGYVIRFEDGHMVKTKGAWYCAIHNAKDKINLEKNVIDAIINERIDDVKPFLLHEDRERVEAFEKVFWEGLNKTALDLLHLYLDYQYSEVQYPDAMLRKNFAQQFVAKQDPLYKSILFRMYEGCNQLQELKNIIKKNVGSQTNIDKVRRLWGGHKWSYEFV